MDIAVRSTMLVRPWHRGKFCILFNYIIKQSKAPHVIHKAHCFKTHYYKKIACGSSCLQMLIHCVNSKEIHVFDGYRAQRVYRSVHVRIFCDVIVWCLCIIQPSQAGDNTCVFSNLVNHFFFYFMKQFSGILYDRHR